jgi:hypothetical protein
MEGPVNSTVMPEHDSSIARDARNWLQALLEQMPVRGQAAVKPLCQILIASWICEQMIADQTKNSGSKKVGFSDIAERIAILLNDPKGNIEVLELQPNLLLLATILLFSEGLQVDPFTKFLDHSIAILRRTDSSSDNEWLLDKRILLHHANILRMSSAPTNGAPQLPLYAFQLSASSEAVESLAQELERQTGWGTLPVEASRVTPPWLGDLIAGLVAQSLRNYDLRSGARLLRLHQYLVAAGAARDRQDLYTALCMHRQSHGPFGWYGPEASALQRASSELHGDLEFLLPTTLEALWTLAERSRCWRLFSSVLGCVNDGQNLDAH